MRKMMKMAAAPLAAAAAMAAVLVGPAGVANAEGTLNLGTTAALVSKGVGALVPVEVTCGQASPSPLGSSVTLLVRQRSGNRIVQGTGSASLVCDGTAHTVEVLVTAKEAPFKPGPALVTASTFFCDPFGCQSVSETGEVRFRN